MEEVKLKPKAITRNVILTGFTSFFTDVSSEMIYPLLQAFMAMIMAFQKALLGPIIGIIEGIAESTASLLKVFSGYYSDKIQKRKLVTISGYGLSAMAKLLLLIGSLGWGFVFLARFFDRVGKGIRTAPRDALISESTSTKTMGKAFGFQRGMDFAGATLGALIAFFLVQMFLDPLTGNLKDVSSFYTIFLVSIIPAFIGVGFLFFLKEKKQALPKLIKKEKPKPNLNFFTYDRKLKVFFVSQAVFTLGNSSNMFLMLRSMDLGFSLSLVILMYLVFNLASTVFSPIFGSLSDRIGRKRVLIIGYLLYGVVYALFGFIHRELAFLLWIFWPAYGIYYGLTEGTEKAFVAEIAPKESKGTALGFYHTIVGICLLPASAIAGLLFALSPSAPFLFGGGMAGISVLLLLFFL
ncbi:MAG: MFS transporter [Spirochaetales bacterium]|nr:MFS transporter [Spirochaetales bacterium]